MLVLLICIKRQTSTSSSKFNGFGLFFAREQMQRINSALRAAHLTALKKRDDFSSRFFNAGSGT